MGLHSTYGEGQYLLQDKAPVIAADSLYRRKVPMYDEEYGRERPVPICAIHSYSQFDAKTGNVLVMNAVRCDGVDCRKCTLATPHYGGE